MKHLPWSEEDVALIDSFSRGQRSADKWLQLAELQGRTRSAVRNQAYRRSRQFGLNPWNQWLIDKLQFLVETKFLSVALAAAMLREYVDGLPSSDVGIRVWLSRYNRPEKKIRSSGRYPGPFRHLHVRSKSRPLSKSGPLSKSRHLRLSLLNEHFKLEWTDLAEASADEEAVAEEQAQLRRILDLEDDVDLAKAVGRLNPGGDRDAWTAWAKAWSQIKMGKDARRPPRKRQKVAEYVRPEEVPVEPRPPTAPALSATCKAADLKKAVTALSRACSRFTPSSEHVVIETAGKNRLRLSAGDVRLGMTQEIVATVAGEGSVACSGRLLVEVCALLKGEVKVNVDESRQVSLDTEDYRELRLSGFGADEMRSPLAYSGRTAKATPGTRLKIPATVFAEAVRQVAVCASKGQEAAPVLEALRFEVKGGEMTLAATDGRRLAEARVEVAGLPDAGPVLLPAKGVLEAVRVCGADGDVELVLSAERPEAIVIAGASVVGLGLIEGAFPTYEKAIPDGLGPRLVVDRVELRQIVTTMSVLAEGLVRTIRVHGTPTTDIEVVALPLAGEAAVAQGWAVVEGESGGDVDVVLNATFVAEALGAIPTDRVEVVAAGPDKAVLLRGLDDTGLAVPGLRHMVMPMRLSRPKV